MDNPWTNLPSASPFVLSEDQRAINAFNQSLLKRNPRDPRVIDTTIPPEPFLGLRDAPVVVLMGNPGRDAGDDEMFRRPWVAEAHRASMVAPGAPIYTVGDKLSDTPPAEAGGEALWTGFEVQHATTVS